MTFCILITTRNQSAKVMEIVRRLRSYDAKVVIVDDFSDEEEIVVLERLHNVEILKNLSQRGRGQALITGLHHILEAYKVDAVFTYDEYLKHNPDELFHFTDNFRENECSLIIGDRLRDYRKMSFTNRCLNNLVSFVASKITRKKIKDVRCGFRLYKASDLKKALMDITDQVGLERKLVYYLAKNGEIENVPIEN